MFMAALFTIAKTWKKPTWVDLEIITLSEESSRKTTIIYVTYRWNLKYDTNELIYKTETDS